MPVQDVNRGRLIQMGLAYTGQSVNQNFYGVLAYDWLNQALLDIYGDMGIEDKVNSICSPGVREINTPMGFLYEKMLIVNGLQLMFHPDCNDLDYLSGSNSLPLWYTYWNKPVTQILLGPMPPDSAYPYTLWYFRSPMEMLNDNTIPELPPKWRPALAKKLAAEIILADGLVHLKDKYNALMMEYTMLKQDFQGWFSSESRQSYPTPTADWD